MNSKGVICWLALLAGLSPCLLTAQNWSVGSSPVIPSGESITVNTAEPNIVRFVDNGALTFVPGGSVTLTGDEVALTNNHTLVGSGIGATGTLTISGGTITKQGAGWVVVGYGGGTGTLAIASGALLSMPSNSFYIACNEVDQRAQPSYGTVTVDGTINCGQLLFTAWFATNLTPPLC